MWKFYTPPKFFTERNPKKWWVCRCFSFSKRVFSGSMLVFNVRGCKILFAKSQAYPRVHRLETFATFRLLGLAAGSACIVGAALMGATTGSVPGGPGWGAGVFLVQFETAAGQTGICSWDLAFINMPVCLHSKSHTDKTVLLYDICFLICDLIVLYIMIRCTFAFAQHIWRVPSCKNTDVCCYVYPRCR